MCATCFTYRGQCVVSTEQRFIYIHVMKSGGSSVHLFLKSALCRLINQSVARPTTKDYFCTASQFLQMPCGTAARFYPNFFRWSLVRHPIPRAVSAWAMASRNLRPNATPVAFNDWALNTTQLRTRVWNFHWLPQTAFLMDLHGCPMYDHVGTMGPSLARDLEAILRRVNSSALWAAYRAGGGLPRDFASPDAVREATYRNLSAVALAALAARYRDDLDKFGFSMEGWRQDGYF